MRQDRLGLTTAELLVMGAAVAVLAIILVPIFSRLAMRARVAQTRSDMRILGSAIESYSADWSIQPAWGIGRYGTRGFRTYNSDIVRRTGNRSGVGDLPSFAVCDNPHPSYGFLTLTTGVPFISTPKGGGVPTLWSYRPYIAKYPVDPFCADRAATFVYWATFPGETWTGLLYGRYETPFGGCGWMTVSPGPDGDYDLADSYYVYNPAIAQPSKDLLYGTNRRGDSFTYDPTNGLVSDGDIFRVR